MLEHFYVNKNTDAQGNHEVHRENCDYLPRPENREYLGFFSNSYDAVRAAAAHGDRRRGVCRIACGV